MAACMARSCGSDAEAPAKVSDASLWLSKPTPRGAAALRLAASPGFEADDRLGR